MYKKVLVSLTIAALLIHTAFLSGCMMQARSQAGDMESVSNNANVGGLLIRSYDDCVAAGFATTRSIPPKCITPSGQTFVKERTASKGPGGCENRCGDGTCQQIVCMAVGCPCAETPINCPQDCANSSF